MYIIILAAVLGFNLCRYCYYYYYLLLLFNNINHCTEEEKYHNCPVYIIIINNAVGLLCFVGSKCLVLIIIGGTHHVCPKSISVSPPY